MFFSFVPSLKFSGLCFYSRFWLAFVKVKSWKPWKNVSNSFAGGLCSLYSWLMWNFLCLCDVNFFVVVNAAFQKNFFENYCDCLSSMTLKTHIFNFQVTILLERCLLLVLIRGWKVYCAIYKTLVFKLNYRLKSLVKSTIQFPLIHRP